MKYVLIVTLLIISHISSSQPIYNASNYANTDSSFILSKVAAEDLFGNDFQGTGAGYTWNFSNLSIASQENINFINPDNSGYFESFLLNCLAGGGGFSCYQQWIDLSDIAKPSVDSLSLGTLNFKNKVDFYTSESSLVQTMIGLTLGNDDLDIPLPIEYDIPDTIFKFPINYQDTYETYSKYTLNLDIPDYQIEYKNHQIRTTSVEGYGDISTPFNDFTNALKVKTIIEHNDTLTYNGSTIPLIQMDDILYTWLHPEYGYPVFEAKGSVITGNTYLFNEATFIDTIRCLEPNAYFMSIPPSSYLDSNNQSTVFFFNLSSNSDNYFWNFGDGINNNSSEHSPSHIYTEAGVYEVKLTACNSICNPQVCDSTSMFIEILDTSSVAINDFETNMISLHPNPASDYIFLNNTNKELSELHIEFFNTQGVLVKQEKINYRNSVNKINIKDLKKGIYFVKINSRKYNKIVKVIKF